MHALIVLTNNYSGIYAVKQYTCFDESNIIKIYGFNIMSYNQTFSVPALKNILANSWNVYKIFKKSIKTVKLIRQKSIIN